MATVTKRDVKTFMKENVNQCLDGHEVNTTMLAENAAWAFDHDEWLDDETHWVWDLAVEVSDWWDGIEL